MPKKKRRSRKAPKGLFRKTTATRLSKPKSTAKKKAGKRKPARAPAKPRAAMPSRAMALDAVASATEAGCLPTPEAIDLVFSCDVPEDLPLSTKLGDLFPDSNRRNQFCQCVADGVPTSRSNIPSGSGKTLQDVVDAIKC